MFVTFAHLLNFIFLLCVASGAKSSPMANRRAAEAEKRTESASLDSFGGFSSLANFDEFFGRGNFDGHLNTETIIIQQQQVVCHRQDINIIQQQLAVLHELAKRVILEQVCEVEVQTIILTQLQTRFHNFKGDLHRQSGRQPGFDSNIAQHAAHLLNSDGSLNSTNLGFRGTDIGNNTLIVGGSNWDDTTSPGSVKLAEQAAQAARNVTAPTPPAPTPPAPVGAKVPRSLGRGIFEFMS